MITLPTHPVNVQPVHITMLDQIHPTEKVQKVNSYPDSVETSSVQSQNQRYSENREINV